MSFIRVLHVAVAALAACAASPVSAQTFSPTDLSCAVLGHQAESYRQDSCLPPLEAVSKAAEDLQAECAAAPEICAETLLRPVQILPLANLPYGRFASGLTGTYSGTKTAMSSASACLFYVTGSLTPDPVTCEAKPGSLPQLGWINALGADDSRRHFGQVLQEVELINPQEEGFFYLLSRLRGAYPKGTLYRSEVENGRVYLKQGLSTPISGAIREVTLSHPKELPVAAINLINLSLTNRVLVRINKVGQTETHDDPGRVESRFEVFRLPQINRVDAVSVELDFGTATEIDLDFDQLGTMRFTTREETDLSDMSLLELSQRTENAEAFMAALLRLGAADIEVNDPSDRQAVLDLDFDRDSDAPNGWLINPQRQLREAKYPRLIALIAFNPLATRGRFESFEVDY